MDIVKYQKPFKTLDAVSAVASSNLIILKIRSAFFRGSKFDSDKIK